MDEREGSVSHRSALAYGGWVRSTNDVVFTIGFEKPSLTGVKYFFYLGRGRDVGRPTPPHRSPRRFQPRVINVDGHPAYARAISELKNRGELGRRCRCRPSPSLHNILEQDHRFVKKRIAASLWFRSVDGALNTIDGYESMNMIRKGQVRWLAKGDIVGQVILIQRLLGIAA